MSPLPQMPAALAPELAKLAAPVVEQVAQRAADGRGTGTHPLTIPALLTEANRHAGRDGVRTTARREAVVALTVPKACKACGVLQDRQDRDRTRVLLSQFARAQR